MDPVMLNQLTNDLCRVLKVNYARFDNDASACFDRIIVALGMLAARRCGMPTEAISTHAKSLELMKYMVKTVYGVSSDSYRGTPFEPLFGTGQGSGASPAVWLSLVVLLLNTLERVIPDRISFRSVDGTIVHKRLVDAFVDDTSIGITDRGSKTLSELTKTLEKVAQTWEQLLHYSGGALNLQKCSWYVMFWDWRNGRPYIRSTGEDDIPIQLHKGSEANPTEIRRQALSESIRILGIHQTPLGDFAHQIRALKIKADKYAGYLQSPRLTPADVRVFHRSIYDPAMRYSLPAVAVEEEELDSIQAKIIPTIVQKLGLTRNLPTAIRHGPISMGGLGLMDLRTEGGIEMIKYFRHEVYGNTEVGKLLLLQLQASQLESGIPTPLLEDPSVSVPYLTPTWILSMRQFMFNHNLRLTISDILQLPLKGERDQYVMNALRLKGYSIRQQTDLNLTRLYLQVTTIADMIDKSEPTKIAEWALNGARSPDFELNTDWPRQHAPSQQQKRLWKRYILSQFIRYDRKWRVPPNETLRERERRQMGPERHTHDTAPRTILSNIKQLTRNKRRLLAHINFAADEDLLWRECQRKQTLTIASDGGLKGRHGTFGWTLSTSKNHVLCEAAGPVDGPIDTANSTRCELGGYTSALILISVLQQFWGKRHKCKFRWLTDSQSAINNVAKGRLPRMFKRRQPDNPDYMSIIQEETSMIRRKITPVWIKGHQSEKHDRVERTHSRDVERNRRADHLATWYREQHNYRQSVERTDHTPAARITISLNGVRLVSQVESCIRFHINGYHLRNYIQSKYRWSNKTWDSIDSEAIGRFQRTLPPAAQVAQVKFMHDQWHTGKVRYRNARIKDPQLRLCPCCKLEEETAIHVLRCRMNPEHHNGLKNFRRSMSPSEPHPVFHLIKEGVAAWINGDTPYTPTFEQFPTKFHDRILAALNDQSTIGWDKAIKGYISMEWRRLATENIYGEEQAQHEQGFKRIHVILKALHILTQEKWKARNKRLHESKDEAMQHIRDTELVEINELYSHPERVRAGDRHYCEQPLSAILRKTPASRRRWLRFMRQSQARVDKDGKRQTRMTDFFRAPGNGTATTVRENTVGNT
jgi:hypothetical protein